MILKRGEQVIQQEPVKMIHKGQTLSGGTLYLTNLRLLYEMKSGGMLGGSMQTVLDAPTSKIANVTNTKPLIPIPFLTKNVVRIEFQGEAYEFGVKDSTRWAATITDCVQRCWDSNDQAAEEAVRQERMRLDQEKAENERKVREEREYNYRLEVDREKAAAERAAYVAKASSSNQVNIGHLGDRHSSTNVDNSVRDSVVQQQRGPGGQQQPYGQQQSYAPPPPPPQGGAKACHNCNEQVQANWKACPACGTPIPSGCRHCGGAVQPHWKACPNCGNPL